MLTDVQTTLGKKQGGGVAEQPVVWSPSSAREPACKIYAYEKQRWTQNMGGEKYIQL